MHNFHTLLQGSLDSRPVDPMFVCHELSNWKNISWLLLNPRVDYRLYLIAILVTYFGVNKPVFALPCVSKIRILSTLTNVKSSTPPHHTPNVIYSISCKDCISHSAWQKRSQSPPVQLKPIHQGTVHVFVTTHPAKPAPELLIESLTHTAPLSEGSAESSELYSEEEENWLMLWWFVKL